VGICMVVSPRVEDHGGPRPSRRRWRIRLTILIGVLALAGTAAAGISSSMSLNSAKSTLSSNRIDLRHLQEQVHLTSQRLAVATLNSEASGNELLTDAANLRTEAAALSHARAVVGGNAASISNLNSCLSGLEQALNEISGGNQAGAAGLVASLPVGCRPS
jgi:hypothetical protein